MKLNESSYRWAIKHLFKESDTDLFPRPYELTIINDLEDEFVTELIKVDLGDYKWHVARRFLVPKDDIAYRNATQLHPTDSIMLAAIIFQFGQLIENKRASSDIVFSYRYDPLTDGTLYKNKNAWNKFWKQCQEEVADKVTIKEDEDEEAYIEYELKDNYPFVVTCDISDFYNQIYLHTIENQLIACGFPNEVKKSIKELLLTLNENSSRGLPIGPHSSHILAEMSLIPIDDSLILQGIPFKRYVDDIIFFCKNEKEARVRIQQLAEILDKEQRMVLQRQKTKIYNTVGFLNLTKKMLIEEPVYDAENEIIEIIRSYTGNDPYLKINLDTIDEDDLDKLSEQNIVDLLDEYIKEKNFEKLRWLYRRLSQIGIPHAIDFSINNYEYIIPALNDVCLYINSCAANYDSDWKLIGGKILEMLEDEIIDANPFYQISLLNLFVYNPNLNHIDGMIKLFKNGSEDIRRKILLASIHYNSAGWIYQLKEEQARFANWTKRAYMIATKSLPGDQKKFLHSSIKQKLEESDILEKLILAWAK